MGDVFLSKPALTFYRPIPYLTIIFDYRLWGNNPFGYHMTNLSFHLFNVSLIFYLLKRLMQSNQTSLICALLFAVHPVQTEAVTYISGRSDPICALFLFSSFYFYLLYLESSTYNRFIFLSGSLSLFLLGLFSKEIALLFPLILFSYDVCFLNSHLRTRLKRMSPFILLTAGFLLFRYLFVRWQTIQMSLDKFYLIPNILLFYLRLLVFPFNLHMQHNLQENDLLLKTTYFICAILVIASSILTISRLTKRKVMSFGLSWFLISLAPFLGILKLNSDVAEHWIYLASFGFFLMIARAKFCRNKLVLSLLILFLSILTVQRNFIWRNDVSIYKDTLKYRPGDPKLHYNLGNAYLRMDLLDGAYKEYSIAIELDPHYVYTLNNLGIVFEKKNEFKKAHQLYKKAITLDPNLEAAKKNLLNLEFIDNAFAEEDIYFDHSLYGEVLAEFLQDGNIDYASLKHDHLKLDRYIKKLAELKPEFLISMSDSERIAFYINVYNALTLKVIIDNYPVKSIKDIPGVWDSIKFKVSGKELTLNQIEHDILRKEFKERRIHFALVCASRGCPVLSKEPFNGDNLEEQLDREAYIFINDKTKVRLDKDRDIIYLSSIFKWFKADFGDVIKFIGKYLPEDDIEFIKSRMPKIQYLNYDWSLNEKLR